MFRCATGKAGNLVQEVWGGKTAQQGQVVDYLSFVLAACVYCMIMCMCAFQDMKLRALDDAYSLEILKLQSSGRNAFNEI